MPSTAIDAVAIAHDLFQQIPSRLQTQGAEANAIYANIDPAAIPWTLNRKMDKENPVMYFDGVHQGAQVAGMGYLDPTRTRLTRVVAKFFPAQQ